MSDFGDNRSTNPWDLGSTIGAFEHQRRVDDMFDGDSRESDTAAEWKVFFRSLAALAVIALVFSIL